MARAGTFTATFTYDGKRRYAYGKTQEEADRNAIRKQALLEAKVKTYTDTTKVSVWAKKWLVSYKHGTVESSWYDHMESIIDKHIIPAIGDMRLRDVKPQHIQMLMNKHSSKSESFQKKLLLVLHQIFDSAVDNDLMDKDPTKRIKVSVTASKRSDRGYRAITDEERSLTIRTAEKHPDIGLFFLIMLYCGCRPQEVCRLKMSDYDAEEKVLTIQRARKKDGSTGSPKSEAGYREIPVSDVLAEKLDKLNKKPNEYMVTSQQGQPLTDTSYRRMWKKFKRQMEIENGAELFRNAVVEPTLAEDFVPYCYRHTYCTDLQDAGVPVTVAQRLMGHSSIKVTADIYTHHSKESFDGARDKIGKYQNKIIGKVYHTCTTPTTPKDPQ